jgi:hypothetical protein
LVVRRATASPMGALDILRARAAEWLAFEAWSGTSINVVAGGASIQDLPLPTFLGATALLAILAAVLVFRRAPKPGALPLAIATIFVLAWFASDVRWQANLARQALATRQQYGGKDWRDKHLAAEDGPLFAFIEAVRAKLPPPPARVFVAADAHYFRDRAAYHLYPHNVYFDPYRDTLPPASALRPGDYVLVYQRRGVQYDAQQQRLRLPEGATVAAELLAADRGAALLRIL